MHLEIRVGKHAHRVPIFDETKYCLFSLERGWWLVSLLMLKNRRTVILAVKKFRVRSGSKLGGGRGPEA
jgi:hypothetical protein